MYANPYSTNKLNLSCYKFIALQSRPVDLLVCYTIFLESQRCFFGLEEWLLEGPQVVLRDEWGGGAGHRGGQAGLPGYVILGPQRYNILLVVRISPSSPGLPPACLKGCQVCRQSVNMLTNIKAIRANGWLWLDWQGEKSSNRIKALLL